MKSKIENRFSLNVPIHLRTSESLEITINSIVNSFVLSVLHSDYFLHSTGILEKNRKNNKMHFILFSHGRYDSSNQLRPTTTTTKKSMNFDQITTDSQSHQIASQCHSRMMGNGGFNSKFDETIDYVFWKQTKQTNAHARALSKSKLNNN